MAEPVSASGKPGKGRPGPRRAAPTTPDALHPTPDRNNENRCINELKPSGANHTYSYLDNGLRWSYQMGGSANVYSLIWDGDDLLNEYINGAGSPSTRYGVLDGEILSRRAGGTRYVLVPDPLGSVNHLIDTSLNKAATLAYWPYGETAVDTGAGSPLRFLGALGYYTATANRVYVRSQQFRPDLVRAQSMPDSRRGQEWWPGLDHWPLPPPIDHRLGNPAKCTEVVSCLNDPNMPRCSSSKNHPASIHLVLCVFWQETSMNGVRDWGIGSCTKEGFDDLVGRRKCEWLARFRDFRDFIRRATPCEKARAARDEIECNGLVAYGPNDGSKGDYAGDLGDRIRGCECCLQHRLPWWTLDDWCSTICFPVVHR